MSIVATNLQQSFCRSHITNIQLQKQHGGIRANNQQPLKPQNSAKKSEQPHVAKKEIKPKQLIKGTTVAAARQEVKPENVKDKPQSQGTKEKPQEQLQHSHLHKAENSATDDYRIYQNGSVNEFFEEKSLGTAPTVAGVCLVNDHFILVKIPEDNSQMYPNKFEESAMSHKNLRDVKRRSEYQKASRRLCCCLRSKRNRITKIAPIHEEVEDVRGDEGAVKSNSKCLKMSSCWQANEPDVEMYQTETKLYQSLANKIDNRSKNLPHTSSPQSAAENPLSPDCKQTSDIPTISGSLLKSSLQCQVALRQYGSLLDSQGNNVSAFNQQEMANRARHRKSPRLDSLYWLLRPFRGKCRKTEPKVQAIVHKTYFVKWTKPPDTLTCGYGVKSCKPSSVLRRWRSALF